MERFWSNSIFKYLRVEPEDHYFLLTEPVCVLSSPVLQPRGGSPLIRHGYTAAQSSREPGEYRGNYVRVVQLRGSLHRRTSGARPGSFVDIFEDIRPFLDRNSD